LEIIGAEYAKIHCARAYFEVISGKNVILSNPGIEVLPILELPHSDGSKQRKISFQAKYFEGKVSYIKIKESMNQAS